MVQIIWTEEARRNLTKIKDYISKDSLYYAEKLINELFQKELKLRKLLFKSYRIIYLLKPEAVYIVAIYHQARQLPSNFDLQDLYE
jgi:toxin ParE1/3/4